MSNMVQYGLWPNCNNNCKFCLRKNREIWSKTQMLNAIEMTKGNLDFIDWQNKFADGISILGGEIYYIKDKEVQDAYLSLIDKIIDKILLKSPSKRCKYSTVSNGLYEPDFLFRVIDRIKEKTGDMRFIDMNFSYDLKYRYASEAARKKALKNIKAFNQRYNYKSGVQMILTQYVIDNIKAKDFNFEKFIAQDIKGCNFCFLYPHPIQTGNILDDFFFKRKDFIEFCIFLKKNFEEVWLNMFRSTQASAVYKWTGLIDKTGDITQQPVLSDGKEHINSCGHSLLYKCYSDSDNCMLCDLEAIGEE